MLQKLVEVEMDSHAAMRQCEALKAALAKLQRVSNRTDTQPKVICALLPQNQVSTVYMSAVTENRELLMGRLEEAQTSNKSLRKLLREEGSYQVPYDHHCMKLHLGVSSLFAVHGEEPCRSEGGSSAAPG